MIISQRRLGILIFITLSSLMSFIFLLIGIKSASAGSEVDGIVAVNPSQAVMVEGGGVNIPGLFKDNEADSQIHDDLSNKKTPFDNPTDSLDESATYIVVMTDMPLARYSGGVSGFSPTSRIATGNDELDVRSVNSQRYLSYLDGRRAGMIKQSSVLLGRSLEVSYQYQATIVGFAAEMTGREALALAELDSVLFVEKEQISYPQTDTGPVWAGAADVWGGEWNALGYEVTLNGVNEVPAVTTNVSGRGVFTYNFYTNELDYEITVLNPDNVQLTMMHIHTGTAGNNGTVIYDFGISSTTSDFNETGKATLTDDQETALVNDGLYINLHSSNNPSGEVRGQIDLSGSLGEGMLVGIIDTGIDPWNPSFAAVGGDGYVHTNPLGAGTYLGVCDPTNIDNADTVDYDPTFPCNDKLIGVWGYLSSDGNPRDTDGHGSHTAGTATGNILFDATIEAPTASFSSTISGVAPHANIIVYDGCSDAGGCPGSALTAARDQALLDGVDVINYSIGSPTPTGDVWNDTEALQWLALRDAGVFVATSNGNTGNGDATTGSPADLPWITSVGASSHNRSFFVSLEVTDSVSMSIEVQGQALAGSYGPAEMIFSDYMSDTEDARLCAPGAFAPGTFNGEIVICERGTYGRVAKGQSVLDGGAGGFVLAQPTEETGGPGSVAVDNHVLPAVHIGYNEYQILRRFLITDATGTVEGTLSGASLDIDNMHGDIMASFSSRGPNGSDSDLIVPNVTAPGRAIWAAYHQGAGGDGDYTYNVIQGTSMSSPHVAGAGALLKAMRPSWTPAEMESALMMTARDTVLDDDGATVASPFAQGAGHIDIAKAIDSPLVMDVTNAEYLAADPSEDNDFFVRDLNIASMGEDHCIQSCSWIRTVENASGETLTWFLSLDLPVGVTGTVDPASFSLAPGTTQDITVVINVADAPSYDEWFFARLTLDEESGDYPDGHMPIAFVASASNIPETLSIETQATSGQVEMDNLLSIDITDFHTEVTGLYKADRHVFTLPQHNNNTSDFPDIFFDDVSTTRFISFTVAAGSFSAIAEIIDTASPDLDLLLFLDVEGDGPDLDDANEAGACQSATGGSSEVCEILSPTAGIYYVAIINYSAATVSGDFVDLATIVLPESGADQGNLSVTGPMSVTGTDPYTITVTYDDASMSAIDKLYGYFMIGTSPSDPGNIQAVRVDLEYFGVPKITLDPAQLESTQAPGTYVTETITLLATGGVLDWSVTSYNGEEVVQDGSFEEGYVDNPYWQAEVSISGQILPICSAATCAGIDLATDGDWYLWFGGIAGISASVEQTVTIPQGEAASLTFNMLMGTADSNVATATLDIYLDNMLVATFTEADLEDYGTYSQVALDVSAFANKGSHLLRMEYSNSTAENYNIFIDEVSIKSSVEAFTCNVIGSIDWLSALPSSGTLSLGATDLEVAYDATYLGIGVYTDTLCLSSNNPERPVFNVPVTLTVNADVPSLKTITDKQYGLPGDVLTFTVELANIGELLGTFDISVTNTGWDLSVADSDVVTLAKGVSETIEIAVTIPATATYPMEDVMTVIATSQAYMTVTDKLMLTTAVGRAESSISDLSKSENASAGEMAAYDVVLTNSGTVSGTFDVLLSGNGWDVSLSQTQVRTAELNNLIVSLEAGESTTVTVNVDVPADAFAGSSDVVTLVMKSQADGSLIDEIALNTTVAGGIPQISAQTTSGSGQLGDTVIYTVNIQNTGTAIGNFSIGTSGNNWVTTSSVITTMDLTPGSSDTFEVFVRIPVYEMIGASDSVTITVINQTTTAPTDTLSLTTSAKGFFNFLPLVGQE